MNPQRSWTCATLIAVTLASPPVSAQSPTSAATPADAPAEATPGATPGTTHEALRAFEGGFDAGQALLERGQPLAAARTWVETVTLLTEGPEHRDNRAAVFEYIAEAYDRALSGPVPRVRLEEALAALDGYVDTVQATYGTDAPIGPQVTAVRTTVRKRLAAMDQATPPAAAKPVVASNTAPKPKVEAGSWGGLAAGGGAALGVGVSGLGLMIAGAVRGKALAQRFDDPARGCDRNAPTGECGEIFSAGRAMNTQLIIGAVIGAAGLIAGTTLVTLAHRRRVKATPNVGRGFAGLVLQGNF
jgi:hypothetical protein